MGCETWQHAANSTKYPEIHCFNVCVGGHLSASWGSLPVTSGKSSQGWGNVPQAGNHLVWFEQGHGCCAWESSRARCGRMWRTAGAILYLYVMTLYVAERADTGRGRSDIIPWIVFFYYYHYYYIYWTIIFTLQHGMMSSQWFSYIAGVYNVVKKKSYVNRRGIFIIAKWCQDLFSKSYLSIKLKNFIACLLFIILRVLVNNKKSLWNRLNLGWTETILHLCM